MCLKTVQALAPKPCTCALTASTCCLLAVAYHTYVALPVSAQLTCIPSLPVPRSKEQVSKLHVYDASTMSCTPLATVALPQRVPYGFHGMWVSREQMKAQSE